MSRVPARNPDFVPPPSYKSLRAERRKLSLQLNKALDKETSKTQKSEKSKVISVSIPTDKVQKLFIPVAVVQAPTDSESDDCHDHGLADVHDDDDDADADWFDQALQPESLEGKGETEGERKISGVDHSEKIDNSSSMCRVSELDLTGGAQYMRSADNGGPGTKPAAESETAAVALPLKKNNADSRKLVRKDSKRRKKHDNKAEQSSELQRAQREKELEEQREKSAALQRAAELAVMTSSKSGSSVVATPLPRQNTNKPRSLNDSAGDSLQKLSPSKTVSAEKQTLAALDVTELRQPRLCIPKLTSNQVSVTSSTAANETLSTHTEHIDAVSTPVKRQAIPTSSHTQQSAGQSSSIAKQSVGPKSVDIELCGFKDKPNMTAISKTALKLISSMGIKDKAVKVTVSPNEQGIPVFTIQADNIDLTKAP